MDVPAGWLIDYPDDQTGNAARLGLLGYRGTPATRAVVTDLEIGPVADLYNGFARAWHRDRARVRTFEETGLTEAELRTRDLAHTAQGRRMIDVEAYYAGSGPIFAAIWLEEPVKVGSLVSVNLTSGEFGQEFQQRRGTHRLTDIETYELPSGERRYAAIWHASCAADDWRELRGMDRATYQQAVDSLGAMGFRVIDFESYRTGNGQRYAAIWERISGRAWVVRSDRTLTEFLNEHHRWTDQGFRVVDFEVYPTANGDRYAGVWAENDARYRLPYRQAMDDSVSAYRARWRVPGVSVAVIQNGTLVYARGFGWADSLRAKEAWSGTVYPIASVSKVLAGTLAARLEAQGVLDLTRPTRDFVDSLPASHSHTIEQLLAKIGCVVHYGEGPEPQERYYRWRRDALATVASSWMLPSCTPGQLYHYSTHGYTLVGAALEEVTGKDIVQLMDEEIIRPMGLWSMRPLEPGGWTSRRSYELAQGYSMDTTTTQGVRPNVPADHEDPSWKILGGGYQSNAPDLARFGWLTLDGAIVSDSVRDNRLWNALTGGLRMWSDTTRPRTSGSPPTALGWEVRAANANRGPVAEHGGTAPVTGRSYLTVYRNDDLVVAVLSNQRNGPGTIRHPVRTLAHALATLVRTTPPP
jgi:CubicO group peptidase (beta-lactamase class C family)